MLLDRYGLELPVPMDGDHEQSCDADWVARVVGDEPVNTGEVSVRPVVVHVVDEHEWLWEESNEQVANGGGQEEKIGERALLYWEQNDEDDETVEKDGGEYEHEFADRGNHSE